MNKADLASSTGFSQSSGLILMIGMGVFFLAIAYVIKSKLVRNTHDFIVSNRRVGLGFGVGAIVSVWTWAMAVMMSTAMTYKWGLSGLFWFVVPNGFAVMAMVPSRQDPAEADASRLYDQPVHPQPLRAVQGRVERRHDYYDLRHPP